jgi:AAA domain (dynein-related subfamily)
MSDHRDGPGTLTAVRDRIRAHVVGRERELDLVLAAVAAGRDILLEGPPGTSKSTLLRAITREWGIPLVFVEGNADLTPAKIVGHHNPARVLREDYSADNFVDGPLLEAMRSGGFLYIEEFNRAPEPTRALAETQRGDRLHQSRPLKLAQHVINRARGIAARVRDLLYAGVNDPRIDVDLVEHEVIGQLRLNVPRP